ncbi:thiamine-phosphate kinase [Corynebacterium anserum]|uniref:Thiamine-monophosphate kinase n=1 Tax=Corynebacterium anserum TaxID=2684406 RepID=A0A7G7YNY8_9CORY|nr:thiamine-phosphate kinase [Corynebacterium anserum]MBC2681807.1 thiamine-phosphate kinase [Corynebacterium anserum]QNH96208.1 thiamine-phosphate kinase [Corynebacterium anserum]
MSGHLTVAEAGESATIAAIQKAAPSSLNGDDAAVLHPTSSNSRHVCTTDVLVCDRHFSFLYSTAYEVGVKAVSQNFADIQAMGARPTAILLGIATPGDTDLGVISDLARGINDAAQPWGAELVGGDVVLSTDLVLSITAIGELGGPAAALTLGGAGVGHRVIASGPIGYSAAGLDILRHYGSREAIPKEDAIAQELVQWHCAPRLEVERGTVARAAGASSMTDNSDGLVRDLSMIAQRSGVRIDLNRSAITPDSTLLHAAEITGVDPWEWVLTGGEDHTLIGTTDARLPTTYRPIGMVRSRVAGDETTPYVTVDGVRPAYTKGWESLR